MNCSLTMMWSLVITLVAACGVGGSGANTTAVFCNMTGALRLVEGPKATEGRVEICLNSTWGTICDDLWETADAQVVCRQLGYPAAGSIPYSLAHFGQGTGPIQLDDVQCSGSEQNLLDCTHLTSHNCTHSEDVGVACGDRVHIGNVSVCSTTLDDQRYQLMMQNGTCNPYLSSHNNRFSPCDDLFTPGVDYVYIPNSRVGGNQSILRTAIESTDEILDRVNSTNPECYKVVTKLLCIHYYLPCGVNGSLHVPRFPCTDTCYYVTEDACRSLWEFAVGGLSIPNQNMGLGLPVCNDTSMAVAFLNLSEDCCSNGGVIISSSSDVMSSTPATTSPTDIPTPTIMLIIGSAVGGGIALLVAMITICLPIMFLCWRRRRRTMRQERKDIAIRFNQSDRTQEPTATTEDTEYTEILRSSSSNSPLVDSTYLMQLSDFIIPGTQIKLLETLGQGEFGIVYRGLILTECGQEGMPKPVAVKTLKGQFSSEDISSIMEESLKMKSFDHLNVLKLVGVCVDAGPAPYILMPLMSHGSLLSYLKKERHNLTVTEGSDQELVSAVQKQLLSMCLQVAQGMTYLASRRFVHRDLAARNCMIDANGIIKVADFGLTEDIYQRNYFRQDSCGVKLPLKWLAPESIHDRMFSEKSDVWAFGVTVWEVFSLGRMPYPGMSAVEVVEFLDKGSRLSQPSNAACSEKM